jgi:hypothetical protein
LLNIKTKASKHAHSDININIGINIGIGIGVGVGVGIVLLLRLGIRIGRPPITILHPLGWRHLLGSYHTSISHDSSKNTASKGAGA